MTNDNTMDALRVELFAALRAVRTGGLDVSAARAAAELGQTIIGTAKAEAEFARVTGRDVVSGLIPAREGEAPRTTPTPTGEKTVDGHVTRHRLK